MVSVWPVLCLSVLPFWPILPLGWPCCYLFPAVELVLSVCMWLSLAFSLSYALCLSAQGTRLGLQSHQQVFLHCTGGCRCCSTCGVHTVSLFVNARMHPVCSTLIGRVYGARACYMTLLSRMLLLCVALLLPVWCVITPYRGPLRCFGGVHASAVAFWVLCVCTAV